MQQSHYEQENRSTNWVASSYRKRICGNPPTTKTQASRWQTNCQLWLSLAGLIQCLPVFDGMQTRPQAEALSNSFLGMVVVVFIGGFPLHESHSES